MVVTPQTMTRNAFAALCLLGSLVPAAAADAACSKIDYLEAKEWSNEQLAAKAREYLADGHKNLLLAYEAVRRDDVAGYLIDDVERCQEGYEMFMRLLKLDPKKDAVPKAR